MLAFGRRTKWLALAVAVVVLQAVLIALGFLHTRPLTPERARAALGERFPELRDAPILACPDGTYLIGDCRCNLATATWWFDPPRPHADPRLRPLFPNYKQSDGWFERDITGRWKRTIETTKVSVCSFST